MRWLVICHLVNSSRRWVVGWALRREEAEADLQRAERKSPACYTYSIQEGAD